MVVPPSESPFRHPSAPLPIGPLPDPPARGSPSQLYSTATTVFPGPASGGLSAALPVFGPFTTTAPSPFGLSSPCGRQQPSPTTRSPLHHRPQDLDELLQSSPLLRAVAQASPTGPGGRRPRSATAGTSTGTLKGTATFRGTRNAMLTSTKNGPTLQGHPPAPFPSTAQLDHEFHSIMRRLSARLNLMDLSAVRQTIALDPWLDRLYAAENQPALRNQHSALLLLSLHDGDFLQFFKKAPLRFGPLPELSSGTLLRVKQRRLKQLTARTRLEHDAEAVMPGSPREWREQPPAAYLPFHDPAYATEVIVGSPHLTQKKGQKKTQNKAAEYENLDQLEKIQYLETELATKTAVSEKYENSVAVLQEDNKRLREALERGMGREKKLSAQIDFLMQDNARLAAETRNIDDKNNGINNNKGDSKGGSKTSKDASKTTTIGGYSHGGYSQQTTQKHYTEDDDDGVPEDVGSRKGGPSPYLLTPRGAILTEDEKEHRRKMSTSIHQTLASDAMGGAMGGESEGGVVKYVAPPAPINFNIPGSIEHFKNLPKNSQLCEEELRRRRRVIEGPSFVNQVASNLTKGDPNDPNNRDIVEDPVWKSVDIRQRPLPPNVQEESPYRQLPARNSDYARVYTGHVNSVGAKPPDVWGLGQEPLGRELLYKGVEGSASAGDDVRDDVRGGGNMNHIPADERYLTGKPAEAASAHDSSSTNQQNMNQQNTTQQHQSPDFIKSERFLNGDLPQAALTSPPFSMYPEIGESRHQVSSRSSRHDHHPHGNVDIPMHRHEVSQQKYVHPAQHQIQHVHRDAEAQHIATLKIPPLDIHQIPRQHQEMSEHHGSTQVQMDKQQNVPVPTNDSKSSKSGKSNDVDNFLNYLNDFTSQTEALIQHKTAVEKTMREGEAGIDNHSGGSSKGSNKGMNAESVPAHPSRGFQERGK